MDAYAWSTRVLDSEIAPFWEDVFVNNAHVGVAPDVTDTRVCDMDVVLRNLHKVVQANINVIDETIDHRSTQYFDYMMAAYFDDVFQVDTFRQRSAKLISCIASIKTPPNVIEEGNEIKRKMSEINKPDEPNESDHDVHNHVNGNDDVTDGTSTDQVDEEYSFHIASSAHVGDECVGESEEWDKVSNRLRKADERNIKGAPLHPNQIRNMLVEHDKRMYSQSIMVNAEIGDDQLMRIFDHGDPRGYNKSLRADYDVPQDGAHGSMSPKRVEETDEVDDFVFMNSNGNSTHQSDVMPEAAAVSDDNDTQHSQESPDDPTKANQLYEEMQPYGFTTYLNPGETIETDSKRMLRIVRARPDAQEEKTNENNINLPISRRPMLQREYRVGSIESNIDRLHQHRSNAQSPNLFVLELLSKIRPIANPQHRSARGVYQRPILLTRKEVAWYQRAPRIGERKCVKKQHCIGMDLASEGRGFILVEFNIDACNGHVVRTDDPHKMCILCTLLEIRNAVNNVFAGRINLPLDRILSPIMMSVNEHGEYYRNDCFNPIEERYVGIQGPVLHFKEEMYKLGSMNIDGTVVDAYIDEYQVYVMENNAVF